MSLIVIIGPAYPLRGGIAAFNERLAQELQQMGHTVTLYTFSLQYPSFLFPGKTQYSAAAPPTGLDIRVEINSINPLNWLKMGRVIRRRRPDLVITRFWLPFMAMSLGSILRLIRRHHTTRIVCIADNIVPHEKRPGDQTLTRYFIGACDAFIAMSQPVMADLHRFTRKPAKLVPHPLYDHFGPRIPKVVARQHLGLNPEEKLLLFFGFIRKYKGLDLLLEAMGDVRIREAGIRLLVAGEFYEDEKPYLELIRKNQLQDRVLWYTRFIPDDQVGDFFCAADAVVQPYRSATQSGITPMAYHYERPMIVTRVGGLPEMIVPGETGLVCQPDAPAIAEAILQFYGMEEHHFLPHLQREKEKYSWKKMAEAVLAPTKDG